MSAWNVSVDGRKTKTPELKQSGQPASGAADSSSRSKSSSEFRSTYKVKSSVSSRMSGMSMMYTLVSILPKYQHRERHTWYSRSASSSATWWRWCPALAWPRVPNSWSLHCPWQPRWQPLQRHWPIVLCKAWIMSLWCQSRDNFVDNLLHGHADRVGDHDHLPPGGAWSPQRVAQDQGAQGVGVVCSQCHPCLVSHCNVINNNELESNTFEQRRGTCCGHLWGWSSLEKNGKMWMLNTE